MKVSFHNPKCPIRRHLISCMYTLPLLHYVCVIHYFGKGKSEHRKNIPNFISKVKKSVIFEFSEHFSQNIASKHGQSKDMTEHAHTAIILHLSKV